MKAPPRLLRDRARDLRANQTDAERILWTRLRDRTLVGAKFRRQQPIGPFVADFCCMERGLVIEIDGGQHATDITADEQRTAFLPGEGYRVLRFWNNDVMKDIHAVLQVIQQALEEAPRWYRDGRKKVR